MLRQWRTEWANLPHRNLAAAALREPPSLKLSKALSEIAQEHRRHVQTRVIQTMIGHGFFGDYYRRMVPTESTACPCGHAPIQTRDHVLADCALHERHRHLLRDVSRNVDTAFILATYKGRIALAKFFEKSRAFAKHIVPIPAAPGPGVLDHG